MIFRDFLVACSKGIDVMVACARCQAVDASEPGAELAPKRPEHRHFACRAGHLRRRAHCGFCMRVRLGTSIRLLNGQSQSGHFAPPLFFPTSI